jgi:integrase
MPLTVKAIDAAKPGDKPRKLFDSQGLFLLVHPNGSKYWRVKYRHHGKEKLLALGVYPDVPMAAAREARDAARKLIKAGLDPVQQRRHEQRQARIQVDNAFEAIAREWHEQMSGRWSAGHAKAVLWSLQRDAFPTLGPRPVAEITPAEVLDTLKAVEKREALEIAGRVLQRVKAVFRYAVQTGRAQVNPAAELTGVLKTRRVTHQPALPREELPAFLDQLDAYDGQPLTRLALNLLILTWTRPGELRGARWAEFDTEGAIWRIPAERMKMQTPHIVPLSRQALALIEELRSLTERFALLFPNQNRITQPISENTMTYAIYRMGYKSRATAHGFRAVASTIANEAGRFRPDVIERQLAHEERNKVRAAYHRAEYLDERRELMQWWADYLDRQRAIGQGRNVVALARIDQSEHGG